MELTLVPFDEACQEIYAEVLYHEQVVYGYKAPYTEVLHSHLCLLETEEFFNLPSLTIASRPFEDAFLRIKDGIGEEDLKGFLYVAVSPADYKP